MYSRDMPAIATGAASGYGRASSRHTTRRQRGDGVSNLVPRCALETVFTLGGGSGKATVITIGVASGR